MVGFPSVTVSDCFASVATRTLSLDNPYSNTLDPLKSAGPPPHDTLT